MKSGHPVPNNANVNGCEWYLSSGEGGPRTVTVHLWGTEEVVYDSWMGWRWELRRCVVCGMADWEDLNTQWDLRHRPHDANP